MSVVNDLKELAKLKSEGMLTDAQFEAAKNKVVGVQNTKTSSGSSKSSGSGAAAKSREGAVKQNKREDHGWDFDGDF